MKRKWDSPPQPEGSRITEEALKAVQLLKQKAADPGKDPLTREVDINDSPARFILTRTQTHAEIYRATGAYINVKGRYKPPNDTSSDRALHLVVTGPTEAVIQAAIAKIEEIMRNAASAQPPPPQHSGSQSPPPPGAPADTIIEKVFVNMDRTDPKFQLVGKLLGPGGQYMKHIASTTGCRVFLKGPNLGHEPTMLTRAAEPLHIFISGTNRQAVDSARSLAENLIETVKKQYADWKTQQNAYPPPPPPPPYGVPPPLGPPYYPGVPSISPPPPVPGVYPPTAFPPVPLNSGSQQQQQQQQADQSAYAFPATRSYASSAIPSKPAGAASPPHAGEANPYYAFPAVYPPGNQPSPPAGGQSTPATPPPAVDYYSGYDYSHFGYAYGYPAFSPTAPTSPVSQRSSGADQSPPVGPPRPSPEDLANNSLPEVGPKRPSPEDLSAYDLPEPNEAAPPPQPKRIAASPPSLREMSPPALAPARSGTKISESERDRPRTRADVASANLDVYNPPKAPGGKKEEKPPATQPPPQPKAHKPFWLAEDKSARDESPLAALSQQTAATSSSQGDDSKRRK